MGSNNSKETAQVMPPTRSLRDALEALEDHQILALIQQVMDERETLLKRQEHLNSLSRLWERTITEADEIARQIKEEARDQAKAEAETILAEARKAAEDLINKQKAASALAAQREFRAAAESWKKEMDAYSESLEALRTRFADAAAQLSSAMMTSFDVLRGRFDTFKKDMEQRLSEAERSVGASGSPSENGETPVTPVETKVPAEAAQEAPATDDTAEVAGRERRIIEILAPRDKERIDRLQAHLEGLEDVVHTDLRHLVDRTLIEVTLIKPLDLVRILSTWPEVEAVQEVAENNERRVQIMLGVEAEIAQEKGILNQRINRIAHRIRPVPE